MPVIIHEKKARPVKSDALSSVLQDNIYTEVRNKSQDLMSQIRVPPHFPSFPGYLAYFILTSVTRLALILRN